MSSIFGGAAAAAAAIPPLQGFTGITIAQASNTSVTLAIGRWWGGAFWEAVLANKANFADTYKAYNNSLAITISTGSTGANGIDAGSQAASTWYYIFMIVNSGSGALAGLVSTSASNPTMPTGYNYALLLGAVYSDSGTHFVPFTQLGNRVWTAAQNLFSSFAATGANTYQSLSLAAVVPPIASVAYGLYGSSTAAAVRIAVAGDNSGTGENICSVFITPSSGTLDSYYIGQSWRCPLLSAQTIYWKAGTTSAINRLDVTGWEY